MTKPSRKALRVLRKIALEETWRVSWNTVDEIVSNGWARFIGLDECGPDEKPHWVLTDTGRSHIS